MLINGSIKSPFPSSVLRFCRPLPAQVSRPPQLESPRCVSSFTPCSPPASWDNKQGGGGRGGNGFTWRRKKKRMNEQVMKSWEEEEDLRVKGLCWCSWAMQTCDLLRSPTTVVADAAARWGRAGPASEMMGISKVCGLICTQAVQRVSTNLLCTHQLQVMKL